MKLLLKLLLGLVLLVVLAVGAVLLLVDPNDFKPEIQQLARDKGQLDLQLDGDIGLSLWPSVALSLPSLKLSSLEGEPLASLKRAEIEVSLLPLLSGQLQMSGVLIDGLELEVRAQPADTGLSQGGSSPDANAMAKPQQHAGLLFDIGRIQISNARIRYTDTAAGLDLTVAPFNFSADNLVSGRAFPAESDFQLQLKQGGEVPSEWRFSGELSSELLLDSARQQFAANGLQLQLQVEGDALPKPVKLDLGGSLSFDQSSHRARLEGLRLALAQLVLNVDLQIDMAAGQPQFSGRLELEPFDAKQLLAELGQPVPPTQDPQALTQVGFSAELGGPAGAVEMNPLKLSLDQSRFEGMVSYQLESGAQRLRLQGDRLDLDRYLPAPAEAAEDAAASRSENPDQAGSIYPKTPMLPVELLQGLQLDVGLGLAQLQVSGLTLEQLKFKLEADQGLVKLPQISGRLYQGEFENSITLDARQVPLKLSVNKRLEAVDLGPLLVDLMEQERFSGRLSLQGDYRMQGNSVYDWVHSLNGSMQAGLKEGRLNGVNLGDTLCRGILQVKGQPLPLETAESYTEFSNLDATAKIRDGVVSNQDLRAALVGISLAGRGTVDLPKEALDYGIDLTVLQEFASANCRIDDKLHNLALPLRCQGGFDTEPAKLCGVDKQRIKRVLAEVGKREVKQKLERKLEQKLEGNEALKGVLKGLFN